MRVDWIVQSTAIIPQGSVHYGTNRCKPLEKRLIQNHHH